MCPVRESGGRTPVRHIEAPADQLGRRLDNFLLTVLTGVPRSRVYRLIRRGEVRVGGRRVSADYRLQAGDQVRVPPVTEKSAALRLPVPEERREQLGSAVLHEDSELLVIDKPAGLAVHGGTSLTGGLIEALRAIRGPDGYLELVHRLDRDTSGCIMIAKSRRRLRSLQDAQRQGRIGKRYLALVLGAWPADLQRIDSRLLRLTGAGSGPKVRPDNAGREARAWFSVLGRYAESTLLEVRLGTGRTHQIRVQAADAGYPIAGDSRYGSFAANRLLRRYGLKRMFLHAAQLEIPRLEGYPGVHVSAPVPVELRAVLERLSGTAV
jgi:23S rRNA pseudouridine955/2504/2580 synthase